MNSPCVVEQASLEDLPRLVELLEEEADVQPAVPCDHSILTEGVKTALEQPGLGRIFVAREHGRILAMATLLTTVSTAEGGLVAMLDDLVVAPAHRNQGIGTLLLDAVRSYAAAQGLLRITLVSEGLNDSTRSFFRKRGFSDSGMIPMRLSFQAVQKF